MNLGDLTNLVEKPFAAVSNIINTPNSAGRYRPFYLRNLLDAVQGRTLQRRGRRARSTLITGASSGIGEATAYQIEDGLTARSCSSLAASTSSNRLPGRSAGRGGKAAVLPLRPHRLDGVVCWPTRSGRPRPRRHPGQQRGQIDPPLTHAVLRPLPRLPAHDAAQLLRAGPTDAGVPGRDASAAVRADRQRLLDRGADPRAALRRLHREQIGARHPVRRAGRRSGNDDIRFTTVHMPLVRTPMISATTIYDRFPVLTPEEAASIPARSSTRPGGPAPRSGRCRLRRRDQPRDHGPAAEPRLPHVRGLRRRPRAPNPKLRATQFDKRSETFVRATRGIHW